MKFVLLRFVVVGYSSEVSSVPFATRSLPFCGARAPPLQVYARMVQDGWLEKPGVQVVFGKWQDVNLASFGPFHGVFFDT